MKRITLEELSQKIQAESYEELCRYVYEQVEAEKLTPVKASKTNGKKPALYRAYWQAQPPADYSAFTEELKYRMSTKISVDYYLRHMEQYKKDRSWVLKLNEYLLHETAQPAAAVSMNERSFQIFGREKFLSQEQGKKILKRCGVDTAQLSFYETSEPLACYSFHRRTPQNLIILENKDTFYSMRRHLLEGGSGFFGVPAGTLIYGAGKGILRSFQDFSFCVEPHMQAAENRIYYFGDLDYEGIGIYERLAQAFDAQRRIEPFVQAYGRMLEKAEARPDLPLAKEGQNRRISGQFFAYFSDEAAGKMRRILEDGRYIPQEILNIGDFKEDR